MSVSRRSFIKSSVATSAAMAVGITVPEQLAAQAAKSGVDKDIQWDKSSARAKTGSWRSREILNAR